MAEQGDRGRKRSVMDLSIRDQEDMEALSYRGTSLGRSPPARSIEKKAKVIMSATREIIEKQTANIMEEVQEMINKSFGAGEEEVFLTTEHEGEKGMDEESGPGVGETDGVTNLEYREVSQAGRVGKEDIGAEGVGLQDEEEARKRELAKRGRRELEREFRSKRGEDMEDEINKRVEERMNERVGKNYRERMEVVKGALGSIYKATNSFSKGRLNFNLSSLAEMGNATGIIHTEIIALMVEMSELGANLREARERNEWLRRELNERESERQERMITKKELRGIREAEESENEGRKVASGRSGRRAREEEGTGRERETRVVGEGEGRQGGDRENTGKPKDTTKEVKEDGLWSKVVGRKTFVDASLWKAQQEEKRKKPEEKSKGWTSPTKQQAGLEIVVVDVREDKRNEQGSRELMKELKLRLLQGGGQGVKNSESHKDRGGGGNNREQRGPN